MVPKYLAVAFVLSLLTAVPAAMAADIGPGQLKFTLSGDDGATAGRLFQYHHIGAADTFPGNSDPTPAGVMVNSCQVWASSVAAAVAITVPAQDVAFQLAFTAFTNIEEVTVEVGKITGGAYAPTSPAPATIPAGTLSPASPDIRTGSVATDAVSLAAGEKLATKVCVSLASNTLTGHAAIETDQGDSFVLYEADNNPNYPTPEFGTIILSAVGLVGMIAGAIHMRRKQA